VAGLSKEEIERGLAQLPGWRLGENEIVKNYKFPTFEEAVAFIVRLAQKAEAANHHPDLQNSYNRVRVALHTWSEEAITDKDLSLAGEIESVAESAPEARWPAWRPWASPPTG
jgi:4a-hydroxytetrahydrobiopterin dehydratase